jgi:hypothetical protein
MANNRTSSSIRIVRGLQSRVAGKARFFALANKLNESTDPAERKRLKAKLARVTFGH